MIPDGAGREGKIPEIIFWGWLMSVQRCPSDSSTTGQRSLSAEGIEEETRCSAPRHNNIPALQELAEKCAPMAAELSILIFLGRHGLVAVAPWQPAPCPLRLLPNGSETPPGAACSWGMASYPPLVSGCLKH